MLKSLQTQKKERTLQTNMIELIGFFISVTFYVIGIVLLGASITSGFFIFHVVVVPLVFKYSKTFRRTLTFANFVQWPRNINFEKPAENGIDGARNLTVEFYSKVDECNIKLGVWHILPKSSYERLKGFFDDNTCKNKLNDILNEELGNSKRPVIFYFHGNSNCRATYHRILMYKFFQRMDYHTIAFDYRGYGDSTNVSPSEAGVVEDALRVYAWLHGTERPHSGPRRPIFVWGHSLGTGISSSLLGKLQHLSKSILELSEPLPLPNGLILEAPFSNMADEVENHPLSKLVTWLPYYDATFVKPFRSHPEHQFRSDVHLSATRGLPILILHAKDDVVVPFRVGLKLYRAVAASRAGAGADCSLHAFHKEQNLGHKYICLAEELPEVVDDFVNAHS